MTAAAVRVCFYGPTGSGKTTVARHVAERYGAELVKASEPLHRLQRMFYEVLELPVDGQDGELLQFLAGKVERERPGWLAGSLTRRVREATSPVVVNDDCRANTYPAFEALGFVFVRVRSTPDAIARRRRADHTPVDPRHPVERGFEAFRMDHELDNSGAIEHTLAAVDELMDGLVPMHGSGVGHRVR
ncbi:AAA family ATPase [Virgisporangium aurantiacum]|uniref:ATPase AAA-type core domain-containing protein n=1 Tax=Virgisporangium aurantiacum TaxID=175570 RepID=A0A8J4E5K8_9ACTN|nr:AAA family ATPase [Virgisporangium aurantiacum]GIJ62214.1 hypothetical protein Vau01_097300 [Virgisporangium aurantiacum]